MNPVRASKGVTVLVAFHADRRVVHLLTRYTSPKTGKRNGVLTTMTVKRALELRRELDLVLEELGVKP